MRDEETDAPEPDRAPGAPHPRETAALFGQAAAEAAFLTAFNAERLHHAWLITGPRGVGKATLAWRIARFCLATPKGTDAGLFGDTPAPATLDIPAEHPVHRRTRALSEPHLHLLRCGFNDKGVLQDIISVDEARKLRAFFQLSVPDGGRRVVIVDAADDLNPSAANALLKLLEEPPPDTVMLLISHRPAGLLPTIRSRCRNLRCTALGAQDMALALGAIDITTDADPAMLAELAAGSVGEAVRLITLDGLTTYARIADLFNSLPQLDRPRAIQLAETTLGKAAAPQFDLLLGLSELFLARLAQTGAGNPPSAEACKGEAMLLARLAPDARAARAWAELMQTLSARMRHGRAVNLDPAALILDMFLAINATAAKLPG